MEKEKYPKSWEVVLLGDFVLSEKGKKPKRLCKHSTKECHIAYIDIKAFEKDIIDQYTDGENSRLCYENDILIVWDGSRSGLVGKGKNGALGSTLARLNFFGINNNYAYYFMKSKYLEINSRAKGAATPHVDPELLWNYELPLPPIEEQNRIVNKIESLLSELDSSIESLKRAKEKLKLYRQSVLKSAFEGKLTEAWREAHSDELEDAEVLLERIKQEREAAYEKSLLEWKASVKAWEEGGKSGKKPVKPRKPKELPPLSQKELESLELLPYEWKWVRFNDISYKIGDIDHKMPKVVDKGFPYISTGNIRADGTIDFTNAKVISKEDFERLSNKIKPEKGDIIFPRYGTIGRNVLVDEDKEFLVSYSCAIIKNISLLNNKYVYYYSLSPVIQKEIQKYIVETTQANIGISSIEKFVFPLASFIEQNKVVEEIEIRFNETDFMVRTIDISLKKAEVLRQSILKSVFEGKLAEQKEGDEPVSALLERIQKEKDKYIANKNVNKSRKRKKKMEESLSLVDVLQSVDTHTLSAKELWQRSKYHDNIEEFYAALKIYIEVDKSIEEYKNEDNDESFLRLVDES